MAGTRSVDGKPVGTSRDEKARTQPPFQHPNKMDVASNGKRPSRADKSKAPERDADATSKKGPKE